MKRNTKRTSSTPKCVFCGRSYGVQFNIFTPRFKPFGTACVECESTIPEGTTVPGTPERAHEEAVALGFPNAEAAQKHSDWLAKNGSPEFQAWLSEIRANTP